MLRYPIDAPPSASPSSSSPLTWLTLSPPAVSYCVSSLLSRGLFSSLPSTPTFAIVSTPTSTPYFPLAILAARKAQEEHYRGIRRREGQDLRDRGCQADAEEPGPPPTPPAPAPAVATTKRREEPAFVICPLDLSSPDAGPDRVSGMLSVLLGAVVVGGSSSSSSSSVPAPASAVVLVHSPSAAASALRCLSGTPYCSPSLVTVLDLSSFLPLSELQSLSSPVHPPTSLHLSSLPSSVLSSNPISLSSFDDDESVPSHVVFTSGTTGRPKGCVSSRRALKAYIQNKRTSHSLVARDGEEGREGEEGAEPPYTVLLCSTLAFDPSLGDVVSTLLTPSSPSPPPPSSSAPFHHAPDSSVPTLALCPLTYLSSSLGSVVSKLRVTHVLATPSLWALAVGDRNSKEYESLRVVALGGEPIPRAVVEKWARAKDGAKNTSGAARGVEREGGGKCRLLATYGVTEACVYQTAGEVFNDDDDDDGDGGDPGPKQEGGGVGFAGSSRRPRRGHNTNVGRPFEGVTVLVVCESDHERVLARTAGGGEEAGGRRTREGESGTDCGDGGDGTLNPTRNSQPFLIGEIVLTGSQLDELSCYYSSSPNSLPSSSSSSSSSSSTADAADAPPPRPKFLTAPSPPSSSSATSRYYYTGDRGYISPSTGDVHIIGRIKGSEGMIKLNGVRVQLEEIEGAVMGIALGGGEASAHGDGGGVVKHCVCKAFEEKDDRKILVAYCLLHKECREQLLLDKWQTDPKMQFVCPRSPLLTLLRTRCERLLKPSCVPSYFVICQETELPLGPTGKSDWRALTLIPPSECLVVPSLRGGGSGDGGRLLRDLCDVAAVLSLEIIAALNLQPNQQLLLTPDADFTSLGGDSLSAVIIMRKMWATHNNVKDCRDVGGEFGELGDAFDPRNLLSSRSLGDYVSFLEKNGVCAKRAPPLSSGPEQAVAAAPAAPATAEMGPAAENSPEDFVAPSSPESAASQSLYDALLESCAMGYRALSVSLLLLGAPPQLSASAVASSSARAFAKAKDRAERKRLWSSQPLHLACLRGDCEVVEMLLAKGAKAMMPDSSGTFPIHYACTGKGRGRSGAAAAAAAAAATAEANAGARERGEGTEEEDDGDDDGDEDDDVDDDDNVDSSSGDTLARVECVRLLLDVGKVSLTAKTSSKQTVLHSASKAGHLNLLKFLLSRWKECASAGSIRVEPSESAAGRTSLDWRDHWNRSSVHWAVLHGYVDVLRLLLAEGSSPTPLLAGAKNKRGSLRRESPLQLAERLWGKGGGEFGELLREHGALG